MTTQNLPTIPLLDDTAPTAGQPMTAPAAPLPAPRVRWAAIVWGTVFAVIAGALLWVITDAGRRDELTAWFAGTSPLTIALLVVLLVGAVLAVLGLVALLRQLGARQRQP